MADSPPAAATAGPPPSADIQDPLPESNFFYRRVFCYGVSVILLGMLSLIVWRLQGDEELRMVAMYLCLLLFMVVTYYMIAPSAEQVVKMLQTAKLFTRGVRTTATATAENEMGRASTTTTTGITPLPSQKPRTRTVVAPGGGGSDFDVAPTSRRTGE